ncbi:hypothetical protein GOV14_00295 [Candidatus Pacearchaeota archaeon]|nr:hypothetical protein [Candidatus Pacearchaeota archaeon]
MKKFILFTLFITIILSGLIVNVDATIIKYPKVTMIGGDVFDASTNERVANADIIVECYRGNEVNIKKTKSFTNGKYIVTFTQDSVTGCFDGDTIKVSAIKGDLFGEEMGIVDKEYLDNLDIGIVNVPMVPEFSVLIASLTILSAVAIFFVVRRK